MNTNLDLLQKLVAADRAGAESLLAEAAIDLRGFLSFARRHRLGTYCYWRLRELGLSGAVTVPLRVGAKATALLEREHNERLLARLRSLSELLERRGVDALFIKGPLFAERFYGSLEARSVADLDILVRTPEDLERVGEVLLDAGFVRSSRILLSKRLSRLFAHHHEFRMDDLPVDVHWALQRHYSFAIDYDRLWRDTTTVDVRGRRVRAASDEYEIVLQILGVLTDLQVGKLTLRSMVDIVHLLRTVDGTIDWREFLAVRSREHLLRPTAFVLHLAMETMCCVNEFRRLDAALKHVIRELPPTTLAHDAVLSSRPLDLRQKLLALRIYETPLPAAIAWWTVSLPFRMMAYGVSQR